MADLIILISIEFIYQVLHKILLLKIYQHKKVYKNKQVDIIKQSFGQAWRNTPLISALRRPGQSLFLILKKLLLNI